MPELPEVETIKTQLSRKLAGKALGKHKVKVLRRRGKILIIDFDNKESLVFHLKLTGQLLLNAKPSKHTRKVFDFNDGTKLVFNDLIKFGWWRKLKSTKALEAELGPEPLDLDFKTFKKLLLKRPLSRIKPLLLDQKFIAGIGNIYANEILFASGVLPARKVKELQQQEIKLIFRNIKKILKRAIALGGSSVRDYIDIEGKTGGYQKYHKVYKKKNCPKCSGKIKHQKISGRTAHFCPVCQK